MGGGNGERGENGKVPSWAVKDGGKVKKWVVKMGRWRNGANGKVNDGQ